MAKPPRPQKIETLAARFLQQRRGRAPAKGAPAVGLAAGKILKPLSQKFGPGVDLLEQNWASIVGDRLSGWSSPDQIRAGILFVVAKGPAAALIEADAPQILERLQTFAGQRAPTKLRVRQGTPRNFGKKPHSTVTASSQFHMQEKVEDTPDARLSSALDKFAQAHERRQRGD